MLEYGDVNMTLIMMLSIEIRDKLQKQIHYSFQLWALSDADSLSQMSAYRINT